MGNGSDRFLGTHINENEGIDRVNAVRIKTGGGATKRLECDGVLLTGNFTPEAELVKDSQLTLDRATRGPEVDQYGRCSDPAYFSAGNVLRAVETAGWCFREGRRAGRLIAASLQGSLANATSRIKIERAPPIEYVVPQVVSLPLEKSRMPDFQLRVDRPCRGTLGLEVNGREIWSRKLAALPNRRIRIPPAPVSSQAIETIRIALR